MFRSAQRHADGRLSAPRLAAAVLTIIAMAAAVGGCGSKGADGPESAEEPATVNVALGAVSPEAATLFIAEVNGYFDEQNVKVNVEVNGPQATTLTVAGRADIAFTGATSALAAGIQKQTQYVYATIVGPGNASILVSPTSGINTLADLSGKTVSSQGVSGASWGEAHAFADYLKSKGIAPFEVVPLGSSQLQADAVISGRNAGASGGPDLFGTQISTGKLKVLVGPESPETKELFPADLIASGFWGSADQIKKNSEGITRFLAALLKANQYLETHPLDEIVNVMLKAPQYQGYTFEAVKTALGFEMDFIHETGGQISPEAWEHSLAAYQKWSLGIDLDHPAVQYESVVNNELLAAAKGRMK